MTPHPWLSSLWPLPQRTVVREGARHLTLDTHRPRGRHSGGKPLRLWKSSPDSPRREYGEARVRSRGDTNLGSSE